MTKSAVIYARQSTKMQQSIPAQIKALEGFAHENDLCIKTIFQDTMSGKNTNREGFNAMRQYLENHVTDCLLVWRYDRLARNMKDLHDFLTFCSEANVRVISLNEQYLNNKNSQAKDTLLLQMLGSIAEYQRGTIKENQQIAYQYMYESGKIVSPNVPYGYQLLSGELSLIEDEACIVRQIFQHYAKGIGYKKIAETLNAAGLLNRADKLWRASRIKSILDNPFYIGQVQSKFGDKNKHNLPIVKQELFSQVHHIQAEKSPASQRVTRRYVLQGKVRCPYCQTVCTPTHTLNGNRDYYYYSCSLYSANGKRYCPGYNINALDIEKNVSQLVTDFLQSDFIRNRLEAQIAAANNQTHKINKQKQHALKQRQKKLLLEFEKGNISDEQLSQKLAELNLRQNNITSAPVIPDSIAELIDLNVTVNNNPTVAQYALYQGIIDKIEVNSEKQITAVYLTGLNQNILEVTIHVS